MNTTTIQADIKTADLPIIETILKKFKAKNITLKEVKDDTEMTKEEFYAMVDEASEGKKTKATKEELFEMLTIK